MAAEDRASEGEWALLRSPAFEAELREVREVGEMVAMYAQLRCHALQMGRKQGWAAYFFKSVYGRWPERSWESVPPMRPTGNTVGLIEARDRRWNFEVKKKRQKEEREAHEQRIGGEKSIDGTRLDDARGEGSSD